METKRRRTKRGDTEQHLRRAMACVKGIPENDLPGEAWACVELAALLRLASDRGLATVPLRQDGTVNETVLGRELQRAPARRRPWEPKRGRAAEPSLLPPSPSARGFQVAEGAELASHPGALLCDLMTLSRCVEKLKGQGAEEARIPDVALEGLGTLTATLTPEDARWFLKTPRCKGMATHDWAFERLTERFPGIGDQWDGPFELLRVYRRDKAKVAAEDRRARAELERRDRG
jgi:hypothetical protein